MQMKKTRPRLTILARITKTAITPTIGRKKMKLEKINRRRNAESLSSLPGIIRLGNNNLMIVIRLTMRLHRFYPSLAARPRDHTVGKQNVYPGIFFLIIISVKISILTFQIPVQHRYRQRLILISECKSLIPLISVRLGRTPFILCIFD
jgi:hypothetical protein